MQDTSHQNKQCCNKCGMRRIPKKSSKYSRTDGKYSQNHFCHEPFRGKNHKQYFLPLSCLCQGLKIKGRVECGQRPYGMYGTTQVADCLLCDYQSQNPPLKIGRSEFWMLLRCASVLNFTSKARTVKTTRQHKHCRTLPRRHSDSEKELDNGGHEIANCLDSILVKLFVSP